MTRAADILRERARYVTNDGHVLMHAPQVVAVAALMEVCIETDGRRYRCVVCDHTWHADERAGDYHAADCPLAALERLIEGEIDAE